MGPKRSSADDDSDDDDVGSPSSSGRKAKSDRQQREHRHDTAATSKERRRRGSEKAQERQRSQDKRRSSTEKKKTSSSSSRNATGGGGEGGETTSDGNNNRSRRALPEKKPSSRSLNQKRHREDTDGSSRKRGQPSSDKNNRRGSEEEKKRSSSSRHSSDERKSDRQTAEKKRSPSRKRSPTSTNGRTGRSSASPGRRPGRGSAEKKSRDGKKGKPGGGWKRRPSLDDFAILEYEKKNRRRSNESSFTKKSKDDIDLDDANKHRRSGKRKSNGGSTKDRASNNLERFEELLSRSSEDKDRGGESERKKRGDKTVATASSHDKRRSIDSDDKLDRPKRRSLDKTSSATTDSRRTSVDSSHHASHVSSKSRKSSAHDESLSSFGSDEDEKVRASRGRSRGGSSSRPQLKRRSSEKSGLDGGGSRPRVSKMASEVSLGAIKGSGRSSSRHKLLRKSSEQSDTRSRSTPKLLRKSSEQSGKGRSRSRPKLLRKSFEKSRNATERPLTRRNSDDARFAKKETGEKRLSLDLQKSDPDALLPSNTAKKDTKDNGRDDDKGERSGRSKSRRRHRRHTEKIRRSFRRSFRKTLDMNDATAAGDDDLPSPQNGAEKSRRRKSRRDVARTMSMRMRSRSREVRKVKRMNSEGDMKALVDILADEEDIVERRSSPLEADRQRSDGEAFGRKSGNGGGRSHRPRLTKKSSNSHHEHREVSLPRRRTGESGELRDGESSKSSNIALEHRTDPGEATSELDSHLAKSRSSRHPDAGTRQLSRSKESKSKDEREKISPKGRKASPSKEVRPRKKTFLRRHKWKCLCCCTLLVLVACAVVVATIVLQAFDKSGLSISVSMEGGESSSMSKGDKEGEDVSMTATSQDAAATQESGPIDISTTYVSSYVPSMVPTQSVATALPTPAPLANVAIVVIVQLDDKPEETGFSLISADNSTTYLSKPIGSLSGRQSELVMEVVSIPERTELVFELTDSTGDGLCCTHGNGYYRVLAGTGDQKRKMISGERSAKYVFTVGMKHALQVGGVDPNEHCKPCSPDHNGQDDCGRCAWCDANEGFAPDTVFSWQCHTEPTSIPQKCFVGPKRARLHDQYVAAMAGCVDGFEARPRIEKDASDAAAAAKDETVCVEEAKCIKTFAFVEPDCDQELPGSTLAKETCQDKIGGVPFGYSWGMNAPRKEECPSSGGFAAKLARRCCVNGVAFCDAFFADAGEEEEEENGKVHFAIQGGRPSPTPANAGTDAPTVSIAPTWDGYPITVLIQLDDFPGETGLSVTSVMQGEIVTFLERRPGHYITSQLVVEKVRIPEGIDAVLTLTDEEGDGICCENGDGYFQVYSDLGSLILDEAGTFASSVSKTFFVGDPGTLSPTISAAPSASVAPTFDRFPITIAVQLDQWSDEVGLSIRSAMADGDYFYEWPAGSFSGRASGLVVETVWLPRDVEATLKITDAGGDGFCCLYGDGYIKVFAGENAADESALLATESAEFDDEKQFNFRAGPAPTLASATTPSPTVPNINVASTAPTSSGQPTVDAVLVTAVLQLDKFSAETAWFIDSSDGLTNFVSRPAGYYEDEKSQKIIETVHLPKGLDYQFKILDFMGDGICCWAGNGWYSLYEGGDINDNSTQLFYGNGDFGRIRVHKFVAGKPKTHAPTGSRAPSKNPSLEPSIAPSLSSKPSVTKYAIEVQIKLDNDSSQTGWSITSVDDGTVIIDRPPGYFSGNDTQILVETIRLEAGEYTFSVLDSNGDGFCCEQGIGYYSLYSNKKLLLFRQGEFEYSYSETFLIGTAPPPTNNEGTISKLAPMLRGSIQSSYYIKRQRKHVDQEP